MGSHAISQSLRPLGASEITLTHLIFLSDLSESWTVWREMPTTLNLSKTLAPTAE